MCVVGACLSLRVCCCCCAAAPLPVCRRPLCGKRDQRTDRRTETDERTAAAADSRGQAGTGDKHTRCERKIGGINQWRALSSLPLRPLLALALVPPRCCSVRISCRALPPLPHAAAARHATEAARNRGGEHTEGREHTNTYELEWRGRVAICPCSTLQWHSTTTSLMLLLTCAAVVSSLVAQFLQLLLFFIAA
jgi:hypothetical protein